MTITRHGDAVTIRGAKLLASAYQATLAGIARRSRDGLPSPELRALARALRDAHDMSHERQEIGTSVPTSPELNGQDLSDLISVADAAGLLRLSRRQVQRLVAGPGGLDGVRVGRTWMLSKAPVLTLARERQVAAK